MDATAAVHPTDQILQSYGLGKLDEATAETVNRHLESCPDCRRRVAEMSSDSFLGRLRDAQGRSDSPAPIVSSIAGLSMMASGPSSAAPPAASTLPPGLAEHPDYEIVRELGQGGMGTVYLALNRLMGRHEVLKVVSSHLMNGGVLDRFLGEIRNAAKLHHPNVVTAYSAMRIGESIIFAMEYVEGLDLAKVVKAKGPLPVANACSYINQAALGLQHAHEQGMVHRDIKPSNLMLSRQGNRAAIKVLDFGLAKVKSEGAVDGGLTHEGQMLGTPDFIAPEQTVDARKADIRADIYSLGCTLYYLLTGGPPFHATSLYEILQAHHSMDAMPLNLARPEVPVELAALVARMMAKEPERRFQTPKEVAQALTPFFKKVSVALTGSQPEVSRAEQVDAKRGSAGETRLSLQPAPSRAAAHAPSAEKPQDIARPQAVWESLIERKESDRSEDAEPSVVAPTRRRPQWIWRAVAGGFLSLGLVVTLAVILRVKTSNGMIELVNLPKEAQVFVDGQEVVVTWPGGDKPAVVTVSTGKHRIKVKKDGLETSGEEVTVRTGGKEEFTVRLIPNSPSKSDEEAPTIVEVSAMTKAIMDTLEKPIPMKFAEETALEDVLRYINGATKRPGRSGIPIYVDPVGLQEADKTMTSTIKLLDLDVIPLKTALRLVLEQLDLAYCVKDDVLIISSPEGIAREQKELPIVVNDDSPATKAIVAILENLISMPFDEETALEDVIKYIKQATRKGENNPGIQIYVNATGLQEADKTMTSTVRNLELEGVPLKTTFRLLLKQLDLAYVVKEGLLIINSSESIQASPENAQMRLFRFKVQGPGILP